MTARQRVYNYFTLERKYPSLDTWLGWGYNRQYYYEVKKDWQVNNFNEPINKKDRMLLDGLSSLANKDGVVAVAKTKDLSSIIDWITFIREDENFKYYIINRSGE